MDKPTTPQGESSPFIYLLNALEGTAQSENPYERGYPEKRQAVLDYVAKLEATRSESVEWVACSERLPEYGPNNDDVLAYTLTGHVITVHPNRIHTLRESAKRDSEDCFYTHWMPLPKGPK